MSETIKRVYPHGHEVDPLYTSGPSTRTYRSNPWWTMVQEHLVEKEFVANEWALNRLEQGASGLLFYVTDQQFLPRILKDIQLPHIDLHLVVEGRGPEVMEALLHHAHHEVVPAGSLRGTLNIDPVEIAARTGKWHEAKMYELGELSRLAPPNFRYMCVNANFYGLAGASTATQLGLAAAHLNFYLEAFGEVGLDRYFLGMTVGSHLFEGMAKIRAARLLWARLLEINELPKTSIELYAETSTAEQTVYDVHTNLLRASTAAFGAVVGGADQVQIKPYTAVAGEGDLEGDRLALNQHYLLAYESYLDRVEDPASGSFFIETLTQQLCEEAWSVFQWVQEHGGILKAFEQGVIQDKVAAEVKLAQPKEVLGVNLFPNSSDQLPDSYVVREVRTREEHQKAFEGADFEPLQPLRWAARLEWERAAQSLK